MPLIIFIIIYLLWKSFYFGHVTQDTKEDANGCGCLMFMILGGMFLFAMLVGALAG